jgi:hypothetical protein
MSKQNRKININQALALCGYNNNIKQNFISFLQKNYCSPKNKLFLFERNKNVPKLFLLQLKIPAKYNDSIYDISILIYFPLNFPFIQPDIFFHKYCSLKINPNCLDYVDEETLRINYDKFYKWGNSLESFKILITELYKKFNKNFPVFTLDNENFDENEEDDCILKEKCCKEIELRRPISNYSSKSALKKPIKNQINSNNTNKENLSDSYENNGTNVNKINNNKKINLNNNIRNGNNIRKKNMNNISNNNISNNNISNNNISNNNINNNNLFDDFDDSILYDEDKAKKYLVQLLISQLYPKINKINFNIKNIRMNLDKSKKNICSEIKDLEEIENQRINIEKSMNLMKNELDSYNNNKNFDEKKKDLSNLDTLLTIKNKNYYVLLSKEKTIEEYILIIKKSYEKQFIDLHTAMNLVRNYSRQIFNIKYKCKNLINKNI